MTVISNRVKRKLADAAICICLFAVLMALVIFPEESISAAGGGLQLCGSVIVPSLFPFFVISSLIIELGTAEKLGRIIAPVTGRLFNIGPASSAALILGFAGGYPVGAKSVASLYESRCIGRDEAERMLAFCNNSGPAFILGIVGAGVFESAKIGLIIYTCHIAAAVITGILFRSYGSGRSSGRYTTSGDTNFPRAFIASVTSSVRSTVNICGFVIFFAVIIRLLHLAGVIPAFSNLIGHSLSPLGFDRQWAERLLTGLLELSSGVWTLKSASGPLAPRMAMAAFMLGWAGLSIQCQTLSFITESGLSVRTFFLGKFLHGCLAAVLTALAAVLIPVGAETIVPAYAGLQAGAFSTGGAAVSLAITAGLSLFVTLFAFWCIKKTGNFK